MSVNSCQNELEFINFWPIVRTQPLKASQNTQHSTIEWPSFKWLLCLILTNFFPQSLEYEDKCEYFMLIQFFLLLLSTHGRKNMLLITEKMHNMLSSINCSIPGNVWMVIFLYLFWCTKSVLFNLSELRLSEYSHKK